MKYKYLRGSKDSREVFEFDISKRGQYITTCVVDVDLLLCGIKTFPCGNGDDFKLTGQQQLDILELVAAERRKITSGIEIKTMESWYGSGLNFEDYCFPGDTVGEDIVSYCDEEGVALATKAILLRKAALNINTIFDWEAALDGDLR